MPGQRVSSTGVEQVPSSSGETDCGEDDGAESGAGQLGSEFAELIKLLRRLQPEQLADLFAAASQQEEQ